MGTCRRGRHSQFDTKCLSSRAMLQILLGHCGYETKAWDHFKRGHVSEEVPQECHDYNINEKRELPPIHAFSCEV